MGIFKVNDFIVGGWLNAEYVNNKLFNGYLILFDKIDDNNGL